MPYSINNAVRTYYEVSGAGPAMLLLHANPFDHNMFLYQVQHFSNRFTVIAPDMRCYGRSDQVTSPFTLSDLAADVYAVCEQEEISQAVVVGVSTGSGTALLMGLDRPDLCSAVVLVGGGSGKGVLTPEELAHPNARMRKYMEIPLEQYHIQHLEDLVTAEYAGSELGSYLLDQVVKRAKEQGTTADGIVEVLRARRGTDMTARLGDMTVPTLVINGEFDNGLAGGSRTAELVPGAVHEILKGSGHACCIENPGVFNALVADFLEERDLMPKA